MLSLITTWNSYLFNNPGKFSDPTIFTYKLLAETDNRDQALLETLRLKPDLLILDPNLPGTASINLMAEIIRISSRTKLLLVLMEDDPIFSIGLSQFLVDGMIFKGDHPACVFETIEKLFKDVFWQNGKKDNPISYSEINTRPILSKILSERELEILGLMVKGYKNHIIAEELTISEKTVEYHIRKIFKKLGTNSRTGAVTKAYQIGIALPLLPLLKTDRRRKINM